MKQALVIIFAGAIAAGCATLAGNDQLPEDQLRPEVAAILQYEFGDSRVPLTTLRDHVTETMKESGLARQSLANELTSVLHLPATNMAKDYACRQLARIGTERNAESIAELLTNPETADMARYALEPIPGDGVDEALTAAIGECEAEVQVGILNTLGRRANPLAKATVQRYTQNKNAAVAEAAQAALEHF